MRISRSPLRTQYPGSIHALNPHTSWYDDVGHMPFWEDAERFDRELATLAGESPIQA
jgi:pimeloyl-ACP methyl ester carboxylesterase